MTAWLVVPEPNACVEVLLKVARVGLVPHSNQAWSIAPVRVHAPLRDAPLDVAEVAGFVVTAGAAAVLALSAGPVPVGT